MEIEYYIERCLTDHLLNTANYQKNSECEATAIKIIDIIEELPGVFQIG